MSDKSSPPNFATLLVSLGSILELKRDVVNHVLRMEKHEISALTQYCMILSNFDGTAADRGIPDYEKATEYSGMSIAAWQSIASTVTQNKPIFVNPAAPLAAIMEIKGTVVVAKTKDGSTEQITIKHRNHSQEVCTVADLVKGVGFDSIVARLQEFARYTRQGVVLPVRSDFLHFLHFLAPFLKFSVDNNKLTVAVNNYLEENFVKELLFEFTPEVNAILRKSIEANHHNHIKKIADVITKANITVPPGAPLFYYVAEQLDLKRVNLPITFFKPKGAKPDWVSRIKEPVDILKDEVFPVIWDNVKKKMSMSGMKISEADIYKTATWSWVAGSFQQFSQNGFELSYFGTLSNYGRVTAIALLILDFCIVNAIDVVLVADGPVASRLAELARREKYKLEINLPGAKCEDEDVTVTSWSAFFRRSQAGKQVLIAADLPEIPALFEKFEYGKLICFFPNLERLNAKSTESIVNVLEAKVVEFVELCPWNARPTPLITLSTPKVVENTTRLNSRVAFKAAIAVCNGFARRAVSNFLGSSLLRRSLKNWRAPKLAKITTVEECFKDLAKRAEVSVLATAFSETFGGDSLVDAEETFEMEEETVELKAQVQPPTDRTKRLGKEIKHVDSAKMVVDTEEDVESVSDPEDGKSEEEGVVDDVDEEPMFAEETATTVFSEREDKGKEHVHGHASTSTYGMRDLGEMVAKAQLKERQAKEPTATPLPPAPSSPVRPNTKSVLPNKKPKKRGKSGQPPLKRTT